MLAPLVLLLVVPGADKDDAEKLFRQMEAKLMKAKTVDCAFDAKVEADKTGTLKGAVLLGEGNKVRIEMSNESGGMKGEETVISDGTKSKASDKGALTTDVPKWLGEAVRAAVARCGVALLSVLGPRPADPEKEFPEKEFKIDEHFQVSDFKLGKKEMVNKQEAQAVQYTLTLKKPKKEKIEVSVWIDPKTQLPLKRVLTGTLDGKKMTITETYTKMEIDGKIDPKQFELPKE